MFLSTQKRFGSRQAELLHESERFLVFATLIFNCGKVCSARTGQVDVRKAVFGQELQRLRRHARSDFFDEQGNLQFFV